MRPGGRLEAAAGEAVGVALQLLALWPAKGCAGRAAPASLLPSWWLVLGEGEGGGSAVSV